METILTFQTGKVEIHFDTFDGDRELQIEAYNEYTNNYIHIYLSPDQINKVINHLAEELQRIGVPVELLLQKEE